MKIIELLESRLKMVKNKLNLHKNQTGNKNREVRRGKLSKAKYKKFELAILEFNKKLAILEDCKNEIQNRPDVEKERLSKFQLNIRDFKRFGEINNFDFGDIKQEDNEINVNEFLDIAENKKRNTVEHPYSRLKKMVTETSFHI